MKMLVYMTALFLGATASAAEKGVSFSRDVAPILLKQCVTCHGQKKSKGSYRLHTFESLLTPGSSKDKPIVAGKAGESELYRLLTTTDADDRMPKDADPLPAAQIETVKRWIEQGAKFDGADKAMALSTLVSAATHEKAPAVYKFPVPITALAFSPDGSQIAASGHNEVTIWNAADGKLVRRIGGVARQTLALAWSADDAVLAVGCGVSGELGEVRLVNPRDGKLVRRLVTLEEAVLDVEFSPNGKQLAVAAGDASMRLFDVATGKQVMRHDDHSDWVMAVAFSADGTRLATASRDKTARVISLSGDDLHRTFRDHEKQVYDVGFAADGTMVYSIGADRRLRTWAVNENEAKDIKGSKKPAPGPGLELPADPLRLRVTEQGVLVCCSDGAVRLVSLDGKSITRTFTGGGPGDWLYSLAFDPGSGRVAAGSYGGEVRVWNVNDGASVLTFTAAPGYKK